MEHKVTFLFAIILAMMAGLSLNPGVSKANDNQTVIQISQSSNLIDFEGLSAGTVVSALESGNGISGNAVTGVISVHGINRMFPPDTNTAMVFDATCPPGGVPESCSGRDADLFKPELGKVLIISEDLDSLDPDDADNIASVFEFDFSGFGSGKVVVESTTVMDLEEAQGEGGAVIELYSEGRDGQLIASVPIPDTGNNGMVTLPVGVGGVDFMKVIVNGSIAIDNIAVLPEVPPMEEILYLSDTAQLDDGISHLFRVVLDETSERANLILLPAGEVNYNHVDTLASTPDGGRLYFVDDGTEPRDIAASVLAYYDLSDDTVHEIGVIQAGGQNVIRINQAAFSPDGVLYITSALDEKLYTLDPETAEAFEVGLVVNQDTRATVNIAGADIAFSAEGTFYLWTNASRNGAPAGLYKLNLPPEDGTVMATLVAIAADPHEVRGLALRENGNGDLVASTAADEIHIHSRNDGALIKILLLYLDDAPFDARAGDMSIGPFISFTSLR